eukprot:scaffold449753_cov18-Prasinocladus_malaysianus.AAC.1
MITESTLMDVRSTVATDIATDYYGTVPTRCTRTKGGGLLPVLDIDIFIARIMNTSTRTEMTPRFGFSAAHSQ